MASFSWWWKLLNWEPAERRRLRRPRPRTAGARLWLESLEDRFAPSANHFLLNNYPASTTAGVANSFMVQALNPDNTVDTGYSGTDHFTSTDAQAVLPADYTFGTTDSGKHTFSATLKTAGTQSLTATDTVTATLTATESGISVSSASTLSASTFLVTGYASPTTAGASYSITVTAQDTLGNTATGYV